MVLARTARLCLVPRAMAVDKVLEGHQLPELEMNDWLVFPNMGAYTSSCLQQLQWILARPLSPTSVTEEFP
ncbi:hypothetical protein M0R45_024835 [Rubus argutus]|uniref:Ornithine decarboxylase n=1 Tax=Rubus argutus TaxID=59490 RepID=A0AAW1WTX1_RUBAR